MTSEEIIRIFLVDDVEFVRDASRTILSAHPSFEVVGEACNEDKALACVATMRSHGGGNGHSDAVAQRHPGDGAHETVFPLRDRSGAVRPPPIGPAPRDDYGRCAAL